MSPTLTSQAAPQARVYGEPQLHTDGELLALAFAPDGTIWSVEEPGVLRHWNAGNGQPLEWLALSDLETLWCFSSDMRVLASASDDVALWDMSSGQMLTAIAQTSWVSALAFNQDPGFLATGHDDGMVRYWDAAGHHQVHAFSLHKKAISALAFDSTGKLLAAAAEDKTISLWDLASGKHLGNLTGHTDRIPALAWQPGAKTLVSAGWDSNARVWDSAKLQPIVLLNNHAQQVTALAFDPAGARLACADSAQNVHVWDFAARKPLYVLKGLPAELRHLAFSRDGKKLACNGDRTICLWDAATGQPLAGVGPRPSAPTRFALDEKGARLASTSGGVNIRLWPVGASNTSVTLTDDAPLCDVRFSPDGKLLAAAASTHVRLWDAAKGTKIRDLDGPENAITTLAFAPDGAHLASAGVDGTAVWIWRVSDGEPVLLIPDALEGCTIETLAFQPGGKLLAIGGVDVLATGGSSGAVSLWDIANRCEVATYGEGTTRIAFHPAGKRIALATLDHSIGFWDLQGADLSAELRGHDDAVTALAFSGDGKWLASGGADRTIRLWDEDGEECVVCEVDSQITDLAFSPDGKFLFSAHGNTTCRQFAVADLLAKK